MYEKDLDVENKRLLRMQSEAKDEHDLRHQVRFDVHVVRVCVLMRLR